MSRDPEKSMTIGCGVWGPVLSAVIIAARAVCGNTPMEEWSVWSWILMTIPITIPFLVLLVAGIVFLAGWIFSDWWLGRNRRRF